MKTFIGIISVLLIAVFSVAYLYFSSLTVDSRNNDRILAAIPSGASMIYQFSNDKSMFEIFRDCPVFEDLTGTSAMRDLSWLKSLLLDNPRLEEATGTRKIFLSLHATASGSISCLWLMPLKKELAAADLENLLKENKDISISTAVSEGNTLLSIKNIASGQTFYLNTDHGLAKGSFSKELLLQSLDNSSKKISPEFIRKISDPGLNDEDALASLFINHDDPGFIKSLFRQSPVGNFAALSNFPAYSGLSINYKSDALTFNGISEIKKGSDDYAGIFLNQSPVKNTIKRVMPYNLSNSIAYGLSDYPRFHQDLKQLFAGRKELDTLDKQMALITKETGINPDRDIKNLWGNEFSTIQLSTYENLALIRSGNGRRLEFFLDPLSSVYSGQVRKINYANLFYYYFGDPLERYSKPFYAITDNLLILSNSPTSVQRFLNEYNSGRSLFKSETFTQFDQLVADQGNISFFYHFSNSRVLMNSLLKRSYSNILDSREYGYRDFYGISFQLSSNRDEFFTNFYIGYKELPSLKPDSAVYNSKDSLPAN